MRGYVTYFLVCLSLVALVPCISGCNLDLSASSLNGSNNLSLPSTSTSTHVVIVNRTTNVSANISANVLTNVSDVFSGNGSFNSTNASVLIGRGDAFFVGNDTDEGIYSKIYNISSATSAGESTGNLVEFYFAVGDKGYFKALLAEQRSASFNVSGRIMVIKPVIITRDEVLLSVDGNLSKSLKERSSDLVGDVEVIISHIYFKN